jgi:sialic acid synthase SpsE
MAFEPLDISHIAYNHPIDYLECIEDMNVPAYKVASFEATDLPLIKYIAATKKPMILSTGMANLAEIEEMVVTAKEAGCQELILLHCISNHPIDHLECKILPNHNQLSLSQRYRFVA